MGDKKKIVFLIITLGGLAAHAMPSFVEIGDPGNVGDASGYGRVDYTYKISKAEISIAEFEASGAGNGNENYFNDGTRTVGANAPAVNVKLYEAMKYCNWLTSGDVDSGAYIFNGASSVAVNRESAISTYTDIFVLPTEDEWYKAAYYTGDQGDPWSLYATGADDVPSRATGGNGWNCLVYDSGLNYLLSGPNYVWAVGGSAEEQNGTYDMMGNVAEWVEDTSGVLRGGGYNTFNESTMSSDFRLTKDPSSEGSSTFLAGFRIVQTNVVPEPFTAGLLFIGGAATWVTRRSLKKTTDETV